MSNRSLRGLRVLVSGAGVAGPAAAYWLSRYGAETTVVEAAPALRTSGFAVDFRGPTHLGVLARMGVLEVGVAYVRFAVEHRAHFEVMYRPTSTTPTTRPCGLGAGARARRCTAGRLRAGQKGRIRRPRSGRRRLVARTRLRHSE